MCDVDNSVALPGPVGHNHEMRPQPLVAVNDVEASSRWYQCLLSCKSAHGGLQYERLESKGVLVLQLHRFEVEHHHGRIGDPANKPYGNGILLWFEVDDFDAAVARAVEMKADIFLPRHRNPPTAMAGRITGNAGCMITMATPSCWQVPTERQADSRLRRGRGDCSAVAAILKVIRAALA